MNNPKLIEALEKLTLSELSRKIYLNVLSNSDLNVSDLSVLLGKYRAKIYEGLNELAKIGLLEKQEQYSRKILVKSPSFVLSLIKQKQFEMNKSATNLQEELPYILSNLAKSMENKQVKTYYGVNEFSYLLATVLDDCADDSQMISFNEHDNIYNIIDTDYFFNIWVEKRIKKNIHNRILANFNNKFVESEKPFDKIKPRELRVLPDSFKNDSCYWIIADKIIFWDTKIPRAILIENKFIADLMYSNFNIIWEISK